MVFLDKALRVVPVLVGSLLLLGAARAPGQQSGQNPPPNAPSANGQSQPGQQQPSQPASDQTPSGQSKTEQEHRSAKNGSNSPPTQSNAASNPFPMAQSEAAAKADAQQNASQSSQPMRNDSSSSNPRTSNPETSKSATSNPPRKSGQSSPAQDNPFPEAQSKAAAKSDDSQSSAAGAGNSRNSGNSQAGSSSSTGKYSSSDAHLPEPDLGEGNPGKHPKMDSYMRDQTPDGREDDDLNAADLYMKNGNYRGGYLRYQDVLEFDPQNDTALYGIADALCRENLTSEAMAHFKSYVTNNPQGKYARQAEKMLAHPEKCMHNR
jgi:hypothetical protein